MDNSEIVIDEQKDDSNIKLTNQFTRDVMIYEEPNALPENYGAFQRYDVDHVDNYGNLQEQLYDYKETYSQVNKKIEEKPTEEKPMTDFEKRLQERQKERDSFQQELLNSNQRTDIVMGYKDDEQDWEEFQNSKSIF